MCSWVPNGLPRDATTCASCSRREPVRGRVSSPRFTLGRRHLGGTIQLALRLGAVCVDGLRPLRRNKSRNFSLARIFSVTHRPCRSRSVRRWAGPLHDSRDRGRRRGLALQFAHGVAITRLRAKTNPARHPSWQRLGRGRPTQPHTSFPLRRTRPKTWSTGIAQYKTRTLCISRKIRAHGPLQPCVSFSRSPDRDDRTRRVSTACFSEYDLGARLIARSNGIRRNAKISPLLFSSVAIIRPSPA